jgi:hypothetical protein
VGPYQGGYAVLFQKTACSRHRAEQTVMGCVSVFDRRSSRLVSRSSVPLAWDADAVTLDRALASVFGADDQNE